MAKTWKSNGDYNTKLLTPCVWDSDAMPQELLAVALSTHLGNVYWQSSQTILYPATVDFRNHTKGKNCFGMLTKKTVFWKSEN